MGRYSSSYSEFCTALKEVNRIYLLSKKMERELEKSKRVRSYKSPFGDKSLLTENMNALCRAAAVLLSGHIEGYVKSLLDIICFNVITQDVDGEEYSEETEFHAIEDLFDGLRKTRDAVKIVRKLGIISQRLALIREPSAGSTQGLEPKAFLKGFSAPYPENIYSVFRKFGFTSLRGDMGRVLQGDFAIIEPSVRTLVEFRNDIAHGDLSRTLLPSEVGLHLQHAQKFVRTLDDCLCHWFNSKGCGLRMR